MAEENDQEFDDDWLEDWEGTDAITDSLDDLDDWIGDQWGIDLLSAGTGWTMIYNFNTVLYLILLIQTLLLCVSIFVVKLRKCLVCFGCCSCTTQLVMVIMTLAYRYDSAGNSCSMNFERYDLSGNNFAVDAGSLSVLSIVGLVAWILMCCCPSFASASCGGSK